jgi:hypothetical protein
LWLRLGLGLGLDVARGGDGPGRGEVVRTGGVGPAEGREGGRVGVGEDCGGRGGHHLERREGVRRRYVVVGRLLAVVLGRNHWRARGDVVDLVVAGRDGGALVGAALELGRVGGPGAIARLDHVRLEGNGSSTTMELQKQAAGVAQHLARLVSPPQWRRRRLAVLANRRRGRRLDAVLSTAAVVGGSGRGGCGCRRRGSGRGLGYFHCTIIEENSQSSCGGGGEEGIKIQV